MSTAAEDVARAQGPDFAFVDQFKVTQKNMRNEPVLPTDDEFIQIETP